MKKVEDKSITGHPINTFETLNRRLIVYKGKYKLVKVGITGRNPQARFNEHLKYNGDWQRMIVIYKTKSTRYANNMEYWLVDKHKNDLINTREGGGSWLSESVPHYYVYLLLA